MATFRAKIYADVNMGKPEKYWNYYMYLVKWKKTDHLMLLHSIGKGRFGEVYKAIDVRNNKNLAVKFLKSDSETQIKREVLILKNLRGGTNIITLEATIMDPITKVPGLIFEYVENTNYIKLYSKFSDFDVRYFIYELLKALDYCHSMGIMHRDVKPPNVVIDYEYGKLRLIDFGASEFYHLGMKYTTQIGTLVYQAPELLIRFPMYNYSIDMWALGCILATIIFKKTPFFCGHDPLEQLTCIAEVLGTEKFNAFINKYQIKVDGYNADLISQPRKAWTSFINDDNRHLASADAFDLLDGLLCYDHIERFSAREAMEHSYFNSIRNKDYRKSYKKNYVEPSRYNANVKSKDSKPSPSSTKEALVNDEPIGSSHSEVSVSEENVLSGTKFESNTDEPWITNTALTDLTRNKDHGTLYNQESSRSSTDVKSETVFSHSEMSVSDEPWITNNKDYGTLYKEKPSTSHSTGKPGNVKLLEASTKPTSGNDERLVTSTTEMLIHHDSSIKATKFESCTNGPWIKYTLQTDKIRNKDYET